MFTCSAADYLIGVVSHTGPQATGTGEFFPDMEDTNAAARRNRFSAAFAALASAPFAIRRGAARLVPASLTATLMARDVARNIKRLERLAPHLLDDIGIEEKSTDVYVLIETGEPVGKAAPALALRPVTTVSQRAGRPSTRWAPGPMTGTVMP